MARQPGFFDTDERLRWLSEAGDPLERLAAVVDFEADKVVYVVEDEHARRQIVSMGPVVGDRVVVTGLGRGVDATGLLAEKEWGKWSGTANLFVINEWGSDIVDELETRLGLQARYRYLPAFEPALELYSGEDTRGIGPAVLGQVRLGNKRQLKWEAGAIFGMDSKSPDTTLRFLLEFEF